MRDVGFDIVLADLSSLGDLAERSDDAVTRLVRLSRGALVEDIVYTVALTAIQALQQAAYAETRKTKSSLHFEMGSAGCFFMQKTWAHAAIRKPIRRQKQPAPCGGFTL